ncbi:uncharacterized protein LOC126648212 isoform X6 [Myiozetetes cayanensis]|uniref:uncharacterized protein LOC126648212 isoform X2 n=1 Tax=Myiozetetes cayanensis TaxID=478635 RepID=UPI00215E3CBB|nr:uncharacterized protein LOC126648212 isoform X2 [Myiozetetes cayanensis]XP_050186898.1 uncharacterized protein LOC126648212 isoform X3 [Myiozetetes cayanensis]XP_050186899.1 uncharacterized protein LOC126648212 isoform X2 [Myiozetetes cayanensis]XP_050186900.1 uncharacterized protein LOC126648212 isoform X2 [Myiozetetes cayanensis]XP_050186901.1 uncharacterized protein LOC126648212 isoform X4 [Myiozetetes cayanensis]XP_050186902.1 uncharacterized protein LOC126648212 isoform X5 [Myiozetetes
MSVPGVPCSGSCKLHLLLKTVTQGVSFLGADKEKNPGTAGSPEAAEGTCFWKVGCKRLFGLSAPEGRRARSAFSIQPVSKVFSGPSCQWSFYESVFALLFRGGMQALVWAIGTRGQTNKVGMQVVFGANSTGVQTKKHEQNGKEVLAVRGERKGSGEGNFGQNVALGGDPSGFAFASVISLQCPSVLPEEQSHGSRSRATSSGALLLALWAMAGTSGLGI